MSNDFILIDTSIWILYLRGEGKSQLREIVQKALVDKKATTSQIIILEILSGAISEKEFTTLYEDFDSLLCLDITNEVWKESYENSFLLRRRGATAPFADILIATASIYYNCQLIHSDKHFGLIAKHIKLNEKGFY